MADFVTVSKFSPTFRYESTCLNFRCVREESEWRVLSTSSATKVIMRSKEINQEPWNVSSWSGDDDVEIERQTSVKTSHYHSCVFLSQNMEDVRFLKIFSTSWIVIEYVKRFRGDSRQKTKEDIQSVLDEAFRAGLDETSSHEVRTALKKLKSSFQSTVHVVYHHDNYFTSSHGR